jgi:hypothetical protein
MAIINWTHKSVGRHPWAQRGSIVWTKYECGTPSTDENEGSQKLEDLSGVEEETRGRQILQMKMEEDEDDAAYARRRQERAKGKKRANEMDGETSRGKRKADEALEEESDRRRPRTSGPNGKMTATQPILVPRLGGRMTAATRPAVLLPRKRMTKAQRAEHRTRLKELRDETETEFTSSMTTEPIPAPEPTPTPPATPAPITAKRKPGRPKGGPKSPVAGQPGDACSTCMEFGVLCVPNPGFSCETCRSRKKKCNQAGPRRGRSASRARQPIPSRTSDTRSKGRTPAESRAPSEAPGQTLRRSSRASSSTRAISVRAVPSAETQERPISESSGQGLKLRIPASRVRGKLFKINQAGKSINHITAATAIRMERSASGSSNALQATNRQSAPPSSSLKAPHNMGLIPGAAYTLTGNPLVSHQEHRAALQRLETIEAENRELRGLVTRALARIEVLEQGMTSLGTICEATRRSVATSPTDFNRAGMGFPFEQEGSTINSDRDLRLTEPSHSTLLTPLSNANPIPSTPNPTSMRWHVGPAIIRSTAPIPPRASSWTSLDIRRGQSIPVTATIYTGQQMTATNDRPIPTILTHVAPLLVRSTTPETPRSMPWTDAATTSRARSTPPNLEVVTVLHTSIRRSSLPPIEVLAEAEASLGRIGSKGGA